MRLFFLTLVVVSTFSMNVFGASLVKDVQEISVQGKILKSEWSITADKKILLGDGQVIDSEKLDSSQNLKFCSNDKAVVIEAGVNGSAIKLTENVYPPDTFWTEDVFQPEDCSFSGTFSSCSNIYQNKFSIYHGFDWYTVNSWPLKDGSFLVNYWNYGLTVVSAKKKKSKVIQEFLHPVNDWEAELVARYVNNAEQIVFSDGEKLVSVSTKNGKVIDTLQWRKYSRGASQDSGHGWVVEIAPGWLYYIGGDRDYCALAQINKTGKFTGGFQKAQCASATFANGQGAVGAIDVQNSFRMTQLVLPSQFNKNLPNKDKVWGSLDLNRRYGISSAIRPGLFVATVNRQYYLVNERGELLEELKVPFAVRNFRATKNSVIFLVHNAQNQDSECTTDYFYTGNTFLIFNIAQ